MADIAESSGNLADLIERCRYDKDDPICNTPMWKLFKYEDPADHVKAVVRKQVQVGKIDLSVL